MYRWNKPAGYETQHYARRDIMLADTVGELKVLIQHSFKREGDTLH